MTYKILFLCKANVGRSQIAEAYYNQMTQSSNAISAALVEDRKDKYNGVPAQVVQDVMKEEKIDITPQRIKLISDLTPDQLNDISYIISLDSGVMLEGGDSEAEYLIGDLTGPAYIKAVYGDKLLVRNIEDPFGKDIEGTRQIRDEIKKHILILL